MTIKGIRQRLGFSQQAFGDKFGIPKRTIQNWEGGQRECPSYILSMIKTILNYESKAGLLGIMLDEQYAEMYRDDLTEQDIIDNRFL